MVKISDCLLHGVALLKKTVENPRMEAEILLAHILKKDRLYIAVHKNEEISPEHEAVFTSMCKRRALGEPLAYITGTKEFMSLEFEVCKSVLIPRPETELLAEYICDKYAETDAKIIDICTGSGAIACSIAHFLPKAYVEAVDISSDAICIAQKNARKNKVDGRINFYLADALLPIKSDIKFDVAVSNPPYIETHVIDSLMRDVRDFEPRIALDGGTDGLIFYEKIVDNIESILADGGELIFEIGYNQAEAVTSIMEQKFKNIVLTKDRAGNDRMLSGQLA